MSEKIEQSKIDFTVQEAQALLELLNLSVKNIGISDGGNVAQNATYFFKKISDAFTPKVEPETKEVKKKK